MQSVRSGAADSAEIVPALTGASFPPKQRRIGAACAVGASADAHGSSRRTLPRSFRASAATGCLRVAVRELAESAVFRGPFGVGAACTNLVHLLASCARGGTACAARGPRPRRSGAPIRALAGRSLRQRTGRFPALMTCSRAEPGRTTVGGAAMRRVPALSAASAPCGGPWAPLREGPARWRLGMRTQRTRDGRMGGSESATRRGEGCDNVLV